ncbi:MAG: ADOP family duplicated permease [Acidobacteriia bacterium]|nr:ADOP family duplicated permease [Terriglobia bacterium]
MRPWRFALRSLSRRPGFALTVLVLLTLGIGIHTALFSVVNTVLLQPLPFPHPAELVTVMEASAAKSQKESLVAPVRLAEWGRLSRTFQAISGSYAENVTDTSMAQPERLAGRRVAPGYFAVLNMPALVGRTFMPEEERTGGPLAAVIGYGLWARRYGLDPAISSRRLMVDGKGYSIVGVMPKSFTSAAIDVWIPAQLAPFLMRMREARFYSGIGRMKPGVGIQQAQADLAAVQKALGDEYPNTDKGWSAAVGDFKEARVGEAGKPLVLLFGAVTLLLAIAISNVAALVLGKLNERERELAIRASLGATRAQVVATVLREIALLAAAGAAGGYALARLSVNLLAKLFADTPRMNELAMDWRAPAFALAASLAGAVAFGLLPALRATAGGAAGTLMRAGRGVAGRRSWTQPALIGGQVALTMLLLAGAGLLLRSFYNLRHVPLGFNPAHSIVFHVGAAWNENRPAIGRVQERLIAGLERVPGVEAAGMANFLPASGASLRNNITLEGLAATEETGNMPTGYRLVSPGYLQALQVPLLAGSWCPELAAYPPGAFRMMVNRRFAEVYGRGNSVIGRHVGFVGYGPDLPQTEIIGVIGDMKEDSLSAPAYPYVYDCARGGSWPDPEYLVRIAGDPLTAANAIRQVVRSVAPGRAIFGVASLEETLDATLDRPRSQARLLALFALAALALAAVGLYGLVTQVVNARRREMGVRMALGAAPGRILRSVVVGAARLIAAGMAVGVGLTFALRPALRAVIFDVSPLDAVSLAGAAALLFAVAILAALVPARRAAAIDPVESMRAE